MKGVTTATGCAVSRTRARSLSFTLDAVALSYIHSLGFEAVPILVIPNIKPGLCKA